MARFKVPAIVVAVLVLALALGFRLEHPASGFKTALGSPSSSVVITKKADTYSVGDKVVVKSASEELSPLKTVLTPGKSRKSNFRFPLANGSRYSGVVFRRLLNRFIPLKTNSVFALTNLSCSSSFSGSQ